MDLYRTKTMLWRGAAVLALAVAASAAGMALWPMDVAASGGASGDTPTTAPAGQGGEGDRPLAHYAVVWQRPLRRPLYDPTPDVKVTAKPPAPKFEYTLTGAVVEEGFSFATFADGRGKTVLRRVGQRIGKAEVKSISADSAQVLLAGKLLTVKKVKKPKSRR